MAVDIHVQADRKLDQRRSVTNGARAIVAALESAGIDYVFGLCGHTNLAMLDALAVSRIQYIGTRHEQVAVHAADGYFRLTHKPAAVLTTIGPGLANALTGLGDAALDGSAMLVICGDVPTYYTGRDAFQETNLHADADQWEIARPVVKRAWRVPHADMLLYDVARAFNYATTGCPGPVLVSVPMDLFSQPFAGETPALLQRRPSSQRIAADTALIARAAEILTRAERPLVYAGGGAILSEAWTQILELAEHLGIPVATSFAGHGVIATDHPLYAGYTATVGTPLAHELVRDADVVLVVGSRLAEMETSSWNAEVSFRVPPTRILQVDIEPTMIGKSYPVEVGLQGDAATVVAQLAERIKARTPRRPWETSPRITSIVQRRKAWRDELAEAARSGDYPMTPERLLADIRAELPPDGVFLTDVGIRHQVMQQFPTHAPLTTIVPNGWGTMGVAVGAVLGAKLARPDRVVIAEVGDGAFVAVNSAVATAVEYGINAVWVVMNNGGYSSISVYQAKHGLHGLGTRFEHPDGTPQDTDYARIAEAYGALGIRVERPAEFRPALARAISANRPAVIDVRTTSTPRVRASGYWDVNDILSGARWEAPRRPCVASEEGP